MSRGPRNIHFCFLLFTYCYYHQASFKTRHTYCSFIYTIYYLFVDVLFSYKYYFIPIFPWFNSSKLNSCLLVTKILRVIFDVYCLPPCFQLVPLDYRLVPIYDMLITCKSAILKLNSNRNGGKKETSGEAIESMAEWNNKIRSCRMTKGSTYRT